MPKSTSTPWLNKETIAFDSHSLREHRTSHHFRLPLNHAHQHFVPQTNSQRVCRPIQRVCCRRFKKQSVKHRLMFVRKHGLCENCFQPDHKVQSCPKNRYFKIPACHTKHSRFLHPKHRIAKLGTSPLTRVQLTKATEERLGATMIMRTTLT